MTTRKLHWFACAWLYELVVLQHMRTADAANRIGITYSRARTILHRGGIYVMSERRKLAEGHPQA